MQATGVFSFVRFLICFAICLLLATGASAQIMMDAGSYSQNFDFLGTAGAGWTNNVTLPGWYASKGGNDSTNYLAGAGAGTAGGLYSFGTNGTHPVAERALGSVASGSATPMAFGVRFYNNTTFGQTNVTVSFTGEQWRNGGSGVSEKLAFSYAVSSSPITNTYGAAAWTAFPALDFSSQVVSTNSSPLDGNLPTNRFSFTNVVLAGVSLQPGQELSLRWLDTDDSGGDDGLAIDDLTVSFSTNQAAPVVPATAAVTYLSYNVDGNSITGTDPTNWAVAAPQVQAIAREITFLDPDIIGFNEIPTAYKWQMTNWVNAFLPGFYLATNSIGDGFVQNYIASRWPIIRSQSWLSSSNLANFGYTNGTSSFTRDLFEAQIAVPGFSQPLHVFVAHLKATTSGGQDDADRRAAEASCISNFFVNVFLTGTNKLHPYILSGDLNEDIFRPETNTYISGTPIQRLLSAPTGLQFTSPTNPFTGAPTNEMTESIRASKLTVRFDYIMPSPLMFSNIVSSQIFRTDKLLPVPLNLNSNDDRVASDHLPVIMCFKNPYQNPFQLLSVMRDESSVKLDWESVPGQTYTIESSSDLVNWAPWVMNIMATNFTQTFSTNTSTGIQFFRVRKTP